MRWISFLLLVLGFSSNLHSQGATLNRTLLHDGAERQYSLYLPDVYTGAEPWPLVINLHGYTGTSALQVVLADMNPVADTGRFLIVYPQGLEIEDPSGGELPLLPPTGTGWNLTDPDGPDDLGFMEAIIDDVALDFNLDPSRVYAAGHSNGGALAYVLACQLSHRIAAVASVAGPGTAPGLPQLVDFPCDPGRPVPVLHMHGTADVVVPYEGDTSLYLPIPEIAAGWAAHNGCSSDTLITVFPDIDPTDGTTVRRVRYTECDEEAEVWFYPLENFGHWWPGAGFDPLFPLSTVFGFPNHDIHGSSEIWDFFDRHRLLTEAEEPLASAPPVVRAFPNPFAAHITVECTLARGGEVSWTVFSPLGQPVGIHTSELLPPGPHRWTWNGGDGLPAGLYVVRLTVDGRTAGRVNVVKGGF